MRFILFSLGLNVFSPSLPDRRFVSNFEFAYGIYTAFAKQEKVVSCKSPSWLNSYKLEFL